jgi:hypothetical protein
VKLIRYACLVLGAASLLFASSTAPDAAANGVVDRIFDAIQSGALPPNDIAILEHAAEGRFLEPDVAVVLGLGISRDSFSPLAYTGDGARAHAYRRIGDLGTEEAILYLAGVTKSDAGKDDSQQVWAAASDQRHHWDLRGDSAGANRWPILGIVLWPLEVDGWVTYLRSDGSKEPQRFAGLEPALSCWGLALDPAGNLLAACNRGPNGNGLVRILSGGRVDPGFDSLSWCGGFSEWSLIIGKWILQS